MPHLQVALHLGIQVDSGISNFSKRRLIFGVEPSPTPMIPICLDSIKVISAFSRKVFAIRAAAIQPAVPPPTTKIFIIAILLPYYFSVRVKSSTVAKKNRGTVEVPRLNCRTQSVLSSESTHCGLGHVLINKVFRRTIFIHGVPIGCPSTFTGFRLTEPCQSF